MRLSRLRGRAFASVLSAAACAAVSMSGCSSGGGSGGDGLGSALDVVVAVAEDGGILPQEGLFLNQRIILQFTEPLRPSSVNTDTVQIRRVTGGFSVPARGDLVVDRDRIVFVPTLPSDTSLSDAGLQADTEYRILLPGFPNSTTVRSVRGRPLSIDFRTTFKTRSSPPLLVDTIPGAPRVEAVFFDLDGNGTFEADGLRSTPEAEEFFPETFGSIPDIRTGSARTPSLIGILLNEPVLPPSVFEDLDGDGQSDNVLLEYTADGLRQPLRVELTQSFRAVEDRFVVLLTLRPRFTLRGLSPLLLQLQSGIKDFSTPPNSLPQFLLPLRTQATVPTSDAFVEEFSTNDFADPEGTALWNVAGSGVLVAGTGLGGNGSDGPFNPTETRVVVEANQSNGGLFNFTSFVVPSGTEVVFQGVPPIRINVLGDVNIAGTLTLKGGDGQIAVVRGQVTAGGLGGPGAGRGGNGNPFGTNEVSRQGETGESVPRFNAMGNCNVGSDPRRGGGCPGARLASGSGSGGGGGHRDAGGSDVAISIQSGQGGLPYGDPGINDLRGGSGGGGGGNDEDGLPFQNDDPGGAGGGGGGAIGFSVDGTFNYRGLINCDGGRGGGGFGQSGAGGGGSGGAIKVRALTIGDLLQGSMTCRGGLGGVLSAPGRPGGGGSPGRIRLESLSGRLTVDRTRFVFDPTESVAPLPPAIIGKSIGASLYYNTGVVNPVYAFNGSDPFTGLLTPGPAATDLQMPRGIPDGTTASIQFFGAHADPNDFGSPDLSTEVGPFTDITTLSGYQFVRFQVLFDIGQEPGTAERPRIEALTLRFGFE